MARQVFGSVSFFRLFKDIVRRFYVLFLVVFAVLFVLVGKADHTIIRKIQAGAETLVLPLVDLAGLPIRGVQAISGNMRELFTVRRENERLLEERKILKEWESVARSLMIENKSLKDLMRYVPPPDLQFITARVVSEAGGAFAQEIIALAGSNDGVRKGHIAMSGDGLVGRVVSTTAKRVHILLITDINSRLPVMIEGTTMRAILAGDNSAQPLLVALPLNQHPRVGDRVVTSHQSDLFPQGLPVGVVSQVSSRTIRVAPFVDPSTVPVVRIVDFGLSSVLPEAGGR